jgi:hypothetical protein
MIGYKVDNTSKEIEKHNVARNCEGTHPFKFGERNWRSKYVKLNSPSKLLSGTETMLKNWLKEQ